MKINNAFAIAVFAALLPLSAKAQTSQPTKDSAAAAPAPAAAATAASDLEKFMGFYQGSGPGRGIMVTVEDGVLYGEPTGGTKTQLFLKSGTTFFVGAQNAPGQVTFKLDKDGNATDLVMRAPSGQERTFPKFRQ